MRGHGKIGQRNFAPGEKSARFGKRAEVGQRRSQRLAPERARFPYWADAG